LEEGTKIVEIKNSTDLSLSLRKQTQPSTLDGALLSLKNDPLLSSTLISLKSNDEEIKRYLSLFLTLQEDLHVCQTCPGLDKCPKESSCTTMKIIRQDDGILSRCFGPCEPLAKLENIKTSYICHDFPESWLGETLSSLRPRTKRITSLLSSFQKALDSSSKRWIYLGGEIGSGRSFLTVCFTNFLAEQGAKVAFIASNSKFDELKNDAINNRNKFLTDFNNLCSCDLLVIDDFGSEFKSDYVRDQIVLPLLNSRAKNNLPIFFLSDYSLDEIKDLYSYSRSATVIAKGLVNLISKNIEEPLYLDKGFESYLKVK
jgi:hypothetical protein